MTWTVALALLIAIGSPIVAEPPASQPAAPPPAEAKPDLDALLKQLLDVDPAAFQQRRDQLHGEIKRLEDENKALQQKIAANQKAAAALSAQVVLLNAILEAKKNQPAAAPAKAPPKPPEPSPPEKVAAINYQDHVRPIFQRRCFTCHSPDKSKGGLVLTSYDALMMGGGTGAVVMAGPASDSRLFRLVNHDESPNMPPEQSKLPDSEIDVIRQWIESGLRADKDAAPKESAKIATTVVPAKPPVVEIAAAALRLESPMTTSVANAPPATAVATHAAAAFVAVGSDGQILFYDATSLELKGALAFEEGRVRRLRLSRGGGYLLAVGGQAGLSGVVALYDLAAGQRVGAFGEFYDTGVFADAGPLATLIATGTRGGRLQVFNSVTGEALANVEAHDDWITALAFDPDGWLLATGDRGGKLAIWEADLGRELHRLRAHDGAIGAAAFSPDGAWLVSGGDDGRIKQWNVRQGKRIRAWSAHDRVRDLAVAPDGKVISCGADGRVRLWQADGRHIRDLGPTGDDVYTASFMRGGAAVAVGRYDGNVHVYNVEDGKQVGSLRTTP